MQTGDRFPVCRGYELEFRRGGGNAVDWWVIPIGAGDRSDPESVLCDPDDHRTPEGQLADAIGAVQEWLCKERSMTPWLGRPSDLENAKARRKYAVEQLETAKMLNAPGLDTSRSADRWARRIHTLDRWIAKNGG